MNILDDWTRRVADEFGLGDEFDRDAILELTRTVAHDVARPAAPVTAFLVGLAAGRAGGTAADVASATQRVTALARDYGEREQG